MHKVKLADYDASTCERSKFGKAKLDPYLKSIGMSGKKFLVSVPVKQNICRKEIFELDVDLRMPSKNA